jgi:hypothetical protein
MIPDMTKHGRPPRPSVVYLRGEEKRLLIERMRAAFAKLKCDGGTEV